MLMYFVVESKDSFRYIRTKLLFFVATKFHLTELFWARANSKQSKISYFLWSSIFIIVMEGFCSSRFLAERIRGFQDEDKKLL